MPKLAASVSLLLWLGATSLAAPEDQADAFRVVVNAANPLSSLSAEEVSQLFLKRVTRWSQGGPVRPVDLPPSSKVRQAFSRSVLRRSVAAVENYWNKRVFSGQDVPPLVQQTESEVLAYVRDNPDAIGYVSADLPLQEVKALTLTGK